MATRCGKRRPGGLTVYFGARSRPPASIRAQRPADLRDGSLRRISPHSVLTLAGGVESGIPREFVVEEPYDSLSFVPTILELMGFIEKLCRRQGHSSASCCQQKKWQVAGRNLPPAFSSCVPVYYLVPPAI